MVKLAWSEYGMTKDLNMGDGEYRSEECYAALKAENERLRQAIEGAYFEGYADASGESYAKHNGKCHTAWKYSRARTKATKPFVVAEEE